MMDSNINKFLFKGEVIEITEENTCRSARILSKPELILVTTDTSEDLHLGDKVILEVNMLIEKVGLEIH